MAAFEAVKIVRTFAPDGAAISLRVAPAQVADLKIGLRDATRDRVPVVARD